MRSRRRTGGPPGGAAKAPTILGARRSVRDRSGRKPGPTRAFLSKHAHVSDAQGDRKGGDRRVRLAEHLGLVQARGVALEVAAFGGPALALEAARLACPE